MLVNLVLLHVREDARVWAYWNYSFNVHLDYPVFLPPEPRQVHVGVAAVAAGLSVAILFAY